MAKISLRAYNREIEKLIDHGQTEEATAHCKYILKLFPKHIDTYRLLGKAYLESQRYSEAADILQRVLAVTPDDFVSQIGLSIIREDEGNLDAAIWNMERAFEVQPSNAAVQDELRRLYGNRDGVEPPRVRLTRGALVRMYTRGELYQQAIAEARAAISEDPKRVDLEILLARNYYLSKNYVEATEICARLVKKLPYCYEANWILSEILPTINKADEAKIFTKRVQELDPYAAFIDRSTPTSAQVPEDTVTLEKLEWMPSMETSEQPQWAKSIGIQIESDAEQDTENWLENLSTPQQGEVTPMPFIVPEVSQPKSEDVIPEWMREDGGSADLETTDHGTAGQSNAFIFDESESLPEEAHLPEWLQSMKPEDADLGQPDIAPISSTNAQSQDISDLPDWMREIESGPPRSSKEPSDWESMDITQPDDSTNTFISAASGMAEESAEFFESEDISEIPEIEPAENVPDWLKDLEQTAQIVEDEPTQETASIGVPPFSSQGMPAEDSAQLSDIPDWLKVPENIPAQEAETLVGSNAFSIDDIIQQEEAPAEEYQPPQPAEQKAEAMDAVPDWLREFDAARQTVLDDLTREETSAVDNIPDWLQELDGPSPAPFAQESAESPALSSAPPDDVPDWLFSIPDGQEPKNPDSNQDLTDWLSEMDAEQESLETPPTAEAIISSIEAENEPEATKPEEIDEAFAWLESLAAKHGADEEALSTPEEERKTDVPDWLQEMGQVESDSTSEPAGSRQSDQAATEDLHEWLEELTSTQHEADQPAAAQADILPDWLQTLGDEEPLLEDTSIEEIKTTLDAQPAVSQSADMSAPPEPGELLPAAEIPDWLQELDAEADTNADVSPTAQADDMPDWLSELGLEESRAEEDEVGFEPSIDQTSSNVEGLNEPAAQMMEEDEQPHDAVISGWLTELEGSTDAEDEIAPAVQAEDFPDWLKEIGQQEPESDDIPILSDQPLEDDGQIQTTSELVQAQPVEEDLSALTEDFEDIAATQDQQLPSQVDDVSSAPSIEESTITDEDDAFAWLESLAARHGADEDALVTNTEERSDVPPEWIQELGKEEIQETDLDQPVGFDGSSETLSINDLDSGVDLLGSSQVEVEPENSMQEDKEAQAREWLQSLASGKSSSVEEPSIDEVAEETFLEASDDDQPTGSSEDIDGLQVEAAAREQTEIQSHDVVAEDESPVLAEQETEAELPEWLKDISEPTAEAEKTEPVPSGNHTVTSWLRDLDEKTTETEQEPAVQLEQTQSTSDEQDPPLRAVQEESIAPIAEIQPDVEEDHQPSPPVAEEFPGAVVEEYTEKQITAHRLLREGQIEQAVTIYEELIKEDENLDAVIKDLNDALYDHPVDTVLWLTLGNAYTQKREMQNALSAYTKAEELLK